VNRLLALFVVFFSTTALAPPAEVAPAPAPAPTPVPAPDVATRVEREQIKREVMDDVRRALEKQREELRDEVRAQIATQTANRSLEEEFQVLEARRRLELFEIDGYFRLRPELFYRFDLDRGADPSGLQLFPSPALDEESNTLAAANMRWRLEPTLNVSESLAIRAQIDVLDRLVLGATPSGAFGFNGYTPFPAASTAQLPPSQDFNWLTDSILVRRAWGEVTTPVGQFLFGRMGSHWGLGMLTNSGNCLDCDYGDTVDRLMFVTTRIAGHYFVPFLDFVSEGPTGMRSNDLFGQPFDRAQLDDGRDYGISIARRDTDVEVARKLAAGQNILNYGVYFVYRTQRWDSRAFDSSPYTPAQAVGDLSFVPRDANLYVPDFWIKYQTQKLRIELELAGVFGTIGSASTAVNDAQPGESLDIVQFGAVAQAEYKLLDKLDLSLEVGFASGDRAAGMGNLQGGGPTQPGSIDGAQYCLDAACAGGIDAKVSNFRFARDYRIDLILWREIFGGITDAIYVKPGVRYELTDGFDLWGNLIYSRAVYGESTPSSRLENGQLVGDPNLGIEFDAGATYRSGDGFVVGIAYGVLFPLAGLDNRVVDPVLEASTAQTIRGWFAIEY
jgi:uncharacterized protein (TIGR04551 family)